MSVVYRDVRDVLYVGVVELALGRLLYRALLAGLGLGGLFAPFFVVLEDREALQGVGHVGHGLAGQLFEQVEHGGLGLRRQRELDDLGDEPGPAVDGVLGGLGLGLDGLGDGFKMLVLEVVYNFIKKRHIMLGLYWWAAALGV